MGDPALYLAMLNQQLKGKIESTGNKISPLSMLLAAA